jgi:hypothetical protein
VNAVLDHPKQFLRFALVDEFLEVGRIGAQAFGEFGPFHARRAVAVGTAAFRKGARPGLHRRGIVERHGRRVGCVPDDRGQTDVGQRRFDQGRIVDHRSHVVEAAEEKHRGSDHAEDGENTDKCQQRLHGRSPGGGLQS